MEAKPVFLLEEERQPLALETRQADVADQGRSALDIPQSLPRPTTPFGAESSSSAHRDSSDPDRLEKMAEREREELEAIKEQSLGSKKPKKRVIKPSEKFRFSFDWENTEDTSRDMKALYQAPHEARLLYGRGFLAGIE